MQCHQQIWSNLCSAKVVNLVFVGYFSNFRKSEGRSDEQISLKYNLILSQKYEWGISFILISLLSCPRPHPLLFAQETPLVSMFKWGQSKSLRNGPTNNNLRPPLSSYISFKPSVEIKCQCRFMKYMPMFCSN